MRPCRHEGSACSFARQPMPRVDRRCQMSLCYWPYCVDANGFCWDRYCYVHCSPMLRFPG